MSMTLMECEAREVPQLIAQQIAANAEVLLRLRKRLQATPPRYALTIGRGSSDHACTYAKYLLETNLGLITASAAPSVVTIYQAQLRMQDALVIGVSQSGRSPDICRMMEVARRDGAVTVAMVNDSNSPLAQIAEFLVPLYAGAERAVAATKSYIASLTALAQLTAVIADHQPLLDALPRLPATLAEVLQVNWEPAIQEFKDVQNTLVIARGFGFPIAQEAALKFKETSAIQAEAFSAAEILHGPFVLIKKQHPYLLFAQTDETLPGIVALAKKIASLGGRVILSLAQDASVTAAELIKIADLVLPMPKSLTAMLDPIMSIQAFYLMVAQLAVARGFNPDAPKNLSKITETF